MKAIKNILFTVLATTLLVACEPELDPITSVRPAADREDPELTIEYPVSGKPVRVIEGGNTTVTFKVTASDDVELKSVMFNLNGSDIGSVTNFKDYRKAFIDFPVDDMPDGDHTLTVTAEDLTGKTISDEVSFTKVTAQPYTPLEGEIIYLPFEGDFTEVVSGGSATKVGSPKFVSGKIGDAYAGAGDSYITYPATDLIASSEFAIAFWYKLNPLPPRGGIIAISPEGESRTSGFRMARENSGDNQNLFINLGVGDNELWLNPFYVVTPGTDWIHIAVSVSSTLASIYINGEVVLETELPNPVDWTGATSISIGSGAPNFVYWEHFSDLSLYDEMHFFNRPLTLDEIQMLYEAL
jgi:hypothetical protein